MKTNELTRQSIIAVIYVVVTILIPYDQFRVSEYLLFVVYFNPKNAIGIILGCFVSNILLGHMALDAIIGTLATAISCGLMIVIKNKYVSYLMPSVVNGLVIGWELFYFLQYPFLFAAGQVFLGEFIVTFVAWTLTLPVALKNKNLERILA